MSTTTSANANASKTEIVKINLSQFADKLQNVELRVKNKKDTIYIYPESFTPEIINSEKGKQHRNSLRTKMRKFTNNIFVYAKINEVEKLKNEISLFEIFYKDNYRINDFSLLSLSQSKDEKKESDLLMMLEIIKEVKKADTPVTPAKKEKKAAVKKEVTKK